MIHEDFLRFFGGASGVDSLMLDDSSLVFAMRFFIFAFLLWLLFFYKTDTNKTCANDGECGDAAACVSGKCTNNRTCLEDLAVFAGTLVFFLSWAWSVSRIQSIWIVVFGSAYAVIFARFVL